jgi:hypothetical protein
MNAFTASNEKSAKVGKGIDDRTTDESCWHMYFRNGRKGQRQKRVELKVGRAQGGCCLGRGTEVYITFEI